MKYILFDLDGTLVDTSAGILQSIKLALDELGVSNINTNDMKCFIGPPLKAGFMEHCGMNLEQASNATKVFRKYYNESGKFVCEPYPQIVQVLESLKQKGYMLAVATSKPTVFAIDILKHLNMEQYFDAIVGSNLDNTRSKKCEVIQYILDTYHIQDLNQVLMVGDKEQDMIGAEICGVHGIGVTYGYGSYEELSSVKNDALLATPWEVHDFVISSEERN